MLSLRIAARLLRKSPVQSILIAAGIAVGIGVQVFLGSLITSLQTSLVDQTIGAVYRLFREIDEELGTAFIIVTHDRSVAQQTDRMLEISDGALLQDVRNEYLAPA